MKHIIIPVAAAWVAGLGLAAACNGQEPLAADTPFSVMSTAVSTVQPAPVGAAKAPSVFDAPQAVGTMATCPVMGNAFAIKADSLHSEHQGKHVYFCCPGCKPQFDADPTKYLK